MSSHPRFKWINVPNAITSARILLVPVFIWLLLVNPDKHDLTRWWVVAIFVLAMSTDGLDGAIARRKGLITNLGKILDPIADKALIGGGLVILSYLGELNWWATALILVRELGITVYRLIVVKKRVIAASSGGKVKTVLQSVMLGLLLSPFDYYLPWLVGVELVLVWATVAVTLYTGGQYVVAAAKASTKG